MVTSITYSPYLLTKTLVRLRLMCTAAKKFIGSRESNELVIQGVGYTSMSFIRR